MLSNESWRSLKRTTYSSNRRSVSSKGQRWNILESSYPTTLYAWTPLKCPESLNCPSQAAKMKYSRFLALLTSTGGSLKTSLTMLDLSSTSLVMTLHGSGKWDMEAQAAFDLLKGKITSA